MKLTECTKVEIRHFSLAERDGEIACSDYDATSFESCGVKPSQCEAAEWKGTNEYARVYYPGRDCPAPCICHLIPATVAAATDAVIDRAAEAAHTLDALLNCHNLDNPKVLDDLFQALAKYNEVTE